MTTFFIIVGFLCVVVGFFGSFLPVLPGVIVSWVGLLLLYCSKIIPINYWIIGISLLLVLVFAFLDYVIPAQGAKRYGGSNYGAWGANIGLVCGILSPIPLGIIIGPFVGAFIGELFKNSDNYQQALRAAVGSLIGFLVSTFLNVVLSIAFLGWFCYVVIQNWEKVF